jgi:type II secretory pathway predicted ATPase ExeA
MNKSLLKEFKAAGVSYSVAVKDLGIPRSSLHAALHGEETPRVKRIVPLIRLWLKQRGAQKAIFKTASMSRFLLTRNASIAEAAKAMSVAGAKNLSPLEAERMIRSGEWDSEERFKKFEAFLEEKKYGGQKKMLTKISLPDEVIESFHLSRDPFTNEMAEHDDIMDTRELARAEKKIMTAVDKSGWVALTGPVGCGKTTLLKRVEAKLARRRDVVIVKPRTIEKQFLGASHVCDSILQDLGVTELLSRRTLEHKARLVGRVLEEAFKDNKKVILLIDEAHLLRADALLALKRLFELEIGFKKLLSIILVGQDFLARNLRTNFQLSEVSQRVDLYELGSINGSLGAYLAHKLERAGASNKELFDRSAVKAIGERFDTPLAVNNIAAAALIAAHDLGERMVTKEIIQSIQGS